MDLLPPFRLTLLGAPSLTTADGRPITGRAAQRHRVALLALLARAPASGLTRDALMGHLWPESPQEQARDLLKASVYVLRRALGDHAVVSAGDRLRLAVGAAEVDTSAFEAALEADELERAVSLYGGPFLDGFFLKNAPEFAHWADRERDRLAGSYARALESLADAATTRGDASASVEWWKSRAAHDPFDTRVALGLVRALDAAGSRAGALRHAALHAALLREELGIEPSSELAETVRALRTRREAPRASVSSPLPPAAAGAAAAGEAAPAPTAAIPPEPARATRRWTPRRAAVSAAVAALLVLAIAFGTRVWPRDGLDADTVGDIARAVAQELTSQQAGSVTPTVPTSRTSDVLAWELYQAANRSEVLRSDSTSLEALGLARRAVALDPGFAEGHALLARLHFRVGPSEGSPLGEADWLELAHEHATRAVEIDSLLVDALGTLGYVDMLRYRFDEAEERLRRATALDPSDNQPWEFLAQLYVWRARGADGLWAAESALAANPRSASARAELARALLVNGRCEEALRELDPIADLEPSLLRATIIAAQCHAQLGLLDQAVADIAEGLPRSGFRGLGWLAFYKGKAGHRREALEILAELREHSERSGRDAFSVALAYAGLGATDEAFVWLDRAVDDHSLTYEIREPGLSELRGDPRFIDLLARLNLHSP